MSPEDWLTSTDPAAMLREFNLSTSSQLMSKFAPPSDRKLRLFACACCRQMWHLLADARSRWAVEVAERYADSMATVEELAAARDAARDATWDAMRAAARDAARDATWYAERAAAWAAAYHAARDAERDSARYAERAAACHVAKKQQVKNLRDIIGNPWEPVTLPPTVRPGDRLKLLTDPYRLVPVASKREAWAATVLEVIGKEMWVAPVGTPSERARWPLPPCPWLTPTVVSLATAAYEERPGRESEETVMGHRCTGCGSRKGDKCRCRIEDGTLDNNRLAVLADALEDAGCVGTCSPCPVCHGSGTYSVQVSNPELSWRNGYSSLTTYSEWRGCRHCGGDSDRKGTGTIVVPNPILTHLRSEGPHVRGCWVLDLLLGKE